MLSHCLKCRNDTESKNLEVVKTKDGRIMLLSKFSLCNSKKIDISNRTRSLLYRLRLKIPLGKVSFLDLLLL